MEAQLAAYRTRKARERQSEIESTHSFIGRFYKGLSSDYSTKDSSQQASSGQADLPSASAHSVSVSHRHSKPTAHSTAGDSRSSALRLPTKPDTRHARISRLLEANTFLLTDPRFLKFILWLILWGLFVELEFGSVFFVLSLFYFLYTSLRSSRQPRQQGELSAYSVFNPNCERIDGTFTAEQFEQELRHGAGSVR